MRILSGIQPSGILHLGNYFGMMIPALQLAEKHNAIYFIADYHALTSIQDPQKLKEYSLNVALDFLACGLDPERTIFFRQSSVPQVCELTWLLSVVTPMGLLERCHSYKDKISKGIPPSHALFTYPILMASDILIYQSHLVPVGKDQKQHLEVTRDIAQKFNDTFGKTFTIPEPYISSHSAIVPGTDGQKMSKSYNNTIPIFEEKSAKKKIMSIVTDSTPVDAPKNPNESTIFKLYSLIASPSEIKSMHDSFRSGGEGYGKYKKLLYESILDHFSPMRQKRIKLTTDPNQIEEILNNGSDKAQKIAQKTLEKARKNVGLITA